MAPASRELTPQEKQLQLVFGRDTSRVQLPQIPLETLGTAKQVPAEFVIEDLNILPNRCWGDDDESRPVQPPIIDMALLQFGDNPHPEISEAATKEIDILGKAAGEVGVFQVANHGIPQELLDRVFEVGQDFFQLPLEEKQMHTAKSGKTEPYGNLAFNIGGVRYWQDALRHHVLPTEAIDEEPIPVKPEAYRPVVQEYALALNKLFEDVGRAMSLYMGVSPESFQKAQTVETRSVIRYNYTPKCPEPEKVLGLAAHKDSGWLTALVQDEVGGLQIQQPGGTRWVDVQPPKNGRLMIQVGYQMEIFSNGRFHGVMHRAMANKYSTRRSVAIFLNPGPECIVHPVLELMEKEKPLYTELVFKDYIPNFGKDLQAGRPPWDRYEANRD